jgi:hypothetical protein
MLGRWQLWTLRVSALGAAAGGSGQLCAAAARVLSGGGGGRAVFSCCRGSSTLNTRLGRVARPPAGVLAALRLMQPHHVSVCCPQSDYAAGLLWPLARCVTRRSVAGTRRSSSCGARPHFQQQLSCRELVGHVGRGRRGVWPHSRPLRRARPPLSRSSDFWRLRDCT